MRLERPVDIRWTLPGLVAGDPTRRWQDGALHLTGRFDGAAYQIAIRSVDGGVDARAWGPGADAALERLPILVGACDDPSGFEVPRPLRNAHRRHPGLRMGAQGRVWELAVAAVLGQKVTMTETGRALGALARRHGEPAPGPPGPWLLPDPDRVASLPSYDLHPLGIERTRAETLRRVAREAARLDRAAGQGPAVLDRALIAIRGVGPWTSALVRDRAIGDPDAVPVGDYHLPNAVAWALAGEPRADDDRMLELLAPHVGHRARVLRLVKASGARAPAYGPRSTPRDIRRM